MKAPAAADLQRWSEEVARDPAALAFVPLARAYRKQGRRDAALRICLRGLEHNATYVEAHTLLALLYFEAGQRAKAYDEWSIVLRLEADNFEALRGMGFYHLEQGDDEAALRSLQRAASIRPRDISVQEALSLIAEKKPAAAPERMPWEEPDPWAAAAPRAPETPATLMARTPHPQAPPTVPAAALQAPARPSQMQTPETAEVTRAQTQRANDPLHLFDTILRNEQMLGALLVDAQGLVLAGSLSNAPAGRAEALGALLGGAIEEAARACALLQLGEWKGILLDADQAMLHLAPVRQGVILVLAAERSTPAGWMLRSAQQAANLAARFLEVSA